MERVYREDLAYIHDDGYGSFARDAATGLLPLLRHKGLTGGRVVDLGCGSGIWAQALVAAGYEVLGIDISEAMIAIARKRVPQAKFQCESFLAAELPPSMAVTALGECFNYLFDRRNSSRELLRLFRRIHDALLPGGVLIFDVAEPGRVPKPGPQRTFRETDDWVVMVEAEEDKQRQLLTRRITSFRKVGALYRRDYEAHQQRLYIRSELARQLRRIGFRVRIISRYGQVPFPQGIVGFLAKKSAEKALE